MLRIIAICIGSFPEILDGLAGSSDAYVLVIAWEFQDGWRLRVLHVFILPESLEACILSTDAEEYVDLFPVVEDIHHKMGSMSVIDDSLIVESLECVNSTFGY